MIKSAMRIKLNGNARAGALECEILIDLPCVNLTWKLSKLAKLRSFCKSIAGDPSLPEVVLLNITGDRFGIAFGLIRLVVVIDIIGPKPI